jgi:L-ascorbate metabolism protein UlaG (beta-lactamase superfamily)
VTGEREAPPSAGPAGGRRDGRLGVDRLTWLGHSTVVLEVSGVRLITDPVLRRRVAFLRRVPPLVLPQLPLHGVLLSHLHADHCDLPSLRRLGDVPVVVPAGAGPWLRRHLPTVVELAAGESCALGDGAATVTVTGTHADHDGRRHPLSHRAAGALGHLVEAGGRRVYVAGDTGLFPGMAELAPALDVAVLPVAGWGPTLGPGHLDPETAADAVALLRPRLAVPVHWGTLAVAGLGAWTTADPAHRFAAGVAARGLTTRVQVLPPGGTTSLPGAGPAAAPAS